MKNKPFFWLIPVLIFILQGIYTLSSTTQIRLEEAIETFRSVWWFKNGLVTDGSYAFLGWYTILHFTYSLLGLGMFTPKIAKLFIELISYFCLAAVLKKYVGIGKGWLPLLLIGMSPTLIYFNSLNLSMGLEVSFTFICVYLITTIRFKTKVDYFKSAFVWSVAMFGWLTYFGFMFYLPLFGCFYLYQLITQRRKFNLQEISKWSVVSLIGFLLPLVIITGYIQNREFLIYDPLFRSGLFRSFAALDFNLDILKDNFERIFSDLFIAPKSYYFEPPKVEFSDFYPLVTIALVFIISAIIFVTQKTKRILIGGLFIFFAVYLILIGFIGPKTLDGIRRGTVLLIIFYTLLTIAWVYVLNLKRTSRVLKLTLTGLICLLLLHHILVYPQNLIAIKKPGQFREQWYFNTDTPQKQLDSALEAVRREEIVLPCLGYNNQKQCMGLSLIYPAIVASCYYNHYHCHKIYTIDQQTGQKIELEIGYWMGPERPTSF